MTVNKAGERIRELRLSLGMTQQELADRAGVERCTITNYEFGHRIPRDETKVRIADALRSDVMQIFFADLCHEKEQ